MECDNGHQIKVLRNNFGYLWISYHIVHPNILLTLSDLDAFDFAFDSFGKREPVLTNFGCAKQQQPWHCHWVTLEIFSFFKFKISQRHRYDSASV